MTTTTREPVITVDAREDGTATITVDGTATELREDSLERVIPAAVRHIVNVVAIPYGAPVTVTARNPREGESVLQIAPSGKVTAAPTAPAEPVAPQPVEAQPIVAAPVEPQPVEAQPIVAAPVEPQPVAAPQINDEVPAPTAAAPVEPIVPQEPAAPSVGVVDGAATRRDRRLTARDFAESKPEPPAAPAAEGWRGSLNRATGGALRIAPGAVELNRRQRRASIQRGIAGHKTILVLNEKGGVGKTTVTWCLGATLGRVRGGTVLAWDNNEYKGTLGIRSQAAAHDHTARDLLNHIGNFTDERHTGELVNFVRPQGENKFDVLASQSLDGDSDVIDAAAFRELHKALSPFYRIIVVDSGNNSRAETWQAAVDAADVLVLATIVKEDSSRTLASLADTLIAQGHEDKLANAVTVMGHTSPTNYPDLERRLVDHMGQLTRSVVSIPYDAALDRGDVIDYDALTPASREAWLTAAAAVMDGLK